MKYLHSISFILVTIGALNWGLVGLGWLMGGADWNVVHMILGSWPVVEGLLYVLVGLSGVYGIMDHKKNCKLCAAKMGI